jgi:hypothetical protein
LFTPYKVEIEGSIIRFFRIVGTIEIQAEDVETIEHKFASANIKYRNGKIRVTSLMDKFHELLLSISSLNPEIVIKKFK